MKPSFFSNKQAAALFDVSEQTIRNWAQQFERYLSPTANPEARRPRRFNEDDMAVLRLVSEMRDQGVDNENIELALQQGQRGERPVATPEDIQTALETDVTAALMNQNEQLMRQIAVLKQEIEALEALRIKNAKLEAKTEIYTEMLTEQQSKIDSLTEQLMQAREKLSAERERNYGLRRDEK